MVLSSGQWVHSHFRTCPFSQNYVAKGMIDPGVNGQTFLLSYWPGNLTKQIPGRYYRIAENMKGKKFCSDFRERKFSLALK